jgi:outer membrane protein assembly factor BamA
MWHADGSAVWLASSESQVLIVPSLPFFPSLLFTPLRWLLVCLALLCVAVLPVAQAEEEDYNQVPEDATGTIAAIRFEGNDVTKDVILRQELTIRPGEAVSRKTIEQSRQALMNLGLFKRVRAHLEPAAESGEGNSQAVIFTVTEKWYVLPLPQFDRDSEGDYPYGFELRWDNFLGYNQSLGLEFERTQRDDGIDEMRQEFSYDIPRIPRTQFGFSMYVQRRDTVVQETDPVLGAGEYDLKLDSFAWSVSRWLLQRGPSVGWRGSFGSTTFKENYDYRSGVDGLITDRKIVEMWVGATYHSVYEYEWHRQGQEYGWAYTLSDRDLGSDDGYSRLDLFYRGYLYPVFLEHDNFNTQVQLGYGNDYDDDIDAYAIGSAKTLRGYDRDDVKGDVLALVNMEYLVPAPRRRALRGVVFVDAGNVYQTSEVDLTDLRYAAGLGLRWKVRSLVRTDLRVDVAWNFEDEEYKIYAGTRYMF